MNYLALAKKMCRAIGYAEPTSIALAGADQSLVLEWLADAWVHIQETEERWSFMQFSATVNALINKSTYTPVEMGLPTLREIVVGRTILTETDGTFIKYMTWVTPAEMEYKTMTAPLIGIPEFYSTERGIVTIYPMPDKAYKANIQYMVNPVVLTLDTDEPAAPEHFHKIILFKALHEYSVSDNSPEQFQFGSVEFEQYLNRMNRECLPQPSMSGRKTGKFYEQKHSNRYSANAGYTV